jgi:hypothetical protein
MSFKILIRTITINQKNKFKYNEQVIEFKDRFAADIAWTNINDSDDFENTFSSLIYTKAKSQAIKLY